MPRYVAFLRAINLGAKRQFPKAAIAACAEAAGGRDVATHINTGNLLLTSSRRSATLLERDLEEVFAADRDFEVPTVAYRWEDFAALVEECDDLAPEAGVRHYLTLVKDGPDPAARERLGSLGSEREWVRVSDAVDGRAVHLFLRGDYHGARLSNAALERVVGVATTRDAKVVRAIGHKWA